LTTRRRTEWRFCDWVTAIPLSESDTRAKLIDPALHACGWTEDLVKREEFEAVKEMARLAREENEALKVRVATLEAALGGAKPSAGAPSGAAPGGSPGL